MSITRTGINRTEAGALGQASFEETVDILFRYGLCLCMMQLVVAGQLAACAALASVL